MGKSKTQSFSEESNTLAEMAKAISHPAKIEILNYLLKAESCVCGDIVSMLPLSQSTVSQHLKVLKDIGIVKGTISGPNMCYCIDPMIWLKFGNLMSLFFNQKPQNLICEPNCC
jgi:predicted transcriptional regulator